VRVLLNTRVKDYVDGKVLLNNGEAIQTSALLWTSGVIGRELPGMASEVIGPGRRVYVDQFQKVLGTDNVFAIGDISLNRSDPGYQEGHPQLAQVAIQQGKLLAANFKRLTRNEEMIPFRYKDKGSMAIISKYKAVADLPTVSIKGFTAWLVWLFIHLIPIAGFRNKVDLLFNWAWSFMTNDPTLRLIIRPEQLDLQREQHFLSTREVEESKSTMEKELQPVPSEKVKA
jgi:NADH:ubiquinone reductase (H+-translocating)